MSNARNDVSGNGETVARCGHMAVQSNGSRYPRSSGTTPPAFDPQSLEKPIGAAIDLEVGSARGSINNASARGNFPRRTSGSIKPMSMLPQETELGYAPPMVRHFSIFLDNRVGKLRELLGDLSEESGVSVRAISIMDSSDYAVIRLIFDKPEIASRFLDRHGYPACQTNVLVAELGKDHELHHLCKFLLGAELNIRFAYPTMPRPDGHPTVVLSTDDNTLAGQILRRKGFRLFGEADLEF